ncbi:MAG: hypothetical protein CME38_08090 [Haliea sp.]|nr:hypothetical protein [Haliea sp.]
MCRIRSFLAAVLWALAGSAASAATGPVSAPPCSHHQPLRQAFFGDLHVHTRYSLDASTQGTRTTPDQAYRFARGEPLGIQPWDEAGRPQRSLQLRRPLDFAMVSDHAELLGEVEICTTPDIDGYNSWQCLIYRYWPRGAFYLFNATASLRAKHLGMCGENGERCLAAALEPWREMREAAQAHNDRSTDCAFTTFIGYEWTASEPRSGGNLHRNVVFRNASVPPLPISFIDAPAASLLWSRLEADCNRGGEGCDSLVIPHNSNLSAGFMFGDPSGEREPLDAAAAAQRRRMEPLVEIMQHKGASECFFDPGVTRDELCAFELLPEDNISGFDNPPGPHTGFLRQVWQQGLGLQAELGINPFQTGVIGSSDTHLGAPGAVEEDRFLGHGGAGVPARGAVPPGLPDKLEYNPGGLAVLWAEENSREALFQAMRRREAYATSGPRILTRLFAGPDLPPTLCGAPDMLETAYDLGVPMGGELNWADSGRMRLLLSAQQDPGTADAPGLPLQKIQVIKGWLGADGQTRERVYDVAGEARSDASVNLATCEPEGAGHASLCAVWEDPDFDPEQAAFYYSRVVENPSCRWSQRQCVAAAVDCGDPATVGEGFEACCAPEHRPVIRERAWTSPIWYRPASAALREPPDPV